MNSSPGFSAGSVAISQETGVENKTFEKYKIAITMNSCSITLDESQYIIANTKQIHMSDT
jgi:hypothetical protein